VAGIRYYALEESGIVDVVLRQLAVAYCLDYH
jgi:hypothetical protein